MPNTDSGSTGSGEKVEEAFLVGAGDSGGGGDVDSTTNCEPGVFFGRIEAFAEIHELID